MYADGLNGGGHPMFMQMGDHLNPPIPTVLQPNPPAYTNEGPPEYTTGCIYIYNSEFGIRTRIDIEGKLII